MKRMKRGHFTIKGYLMFTLSLMAVLLLCVCVGSVNIPLSDTVTAVWNSVFGLPIPEDVSKSIILSVRLPRVLCVALVGASLSLCGAADRGAEPQAASARVPVFRGHFFAAGGFGGAGHPAAYRAVHRGGHVAGGGGGVCDHLRPRAEGGSLMLQAESLTVRYGEKTVVDGVSFSLLPGQWVMLVGPNGAGKSTLIRAVAQTVPYTGYVYLEGKNLAALRVAARVLTPENLQAVYGMDVYAWMRELLESWQE